MNWPLPLRSEVSAAEQRSILSRRFALYYLFFAGFFSLFLFSCSEQADVTDDTVVAQIGTYEMTVRDFRIAYELAPANKKPRTGDALARKRAFLESLIEDKLLVLAGLRKGLDQQAQIQRVLKWHERQAVIQALYNDVVEGHVEVIESEVREAYVLLNQRLFLRQLLFPSEKVALEAYQRIRKGTTFEEVALKYARSEADLQHMLSPKEFQWGELDEHLEAVGYGLNHREVSAPVRSSLGYHLLQLVDRKENVMLTESGFEARRNYVETILRRRKGAHRAKAYLLSLTANQHPQIKGKTLSTLVHRTQVILHNLDTPPSPLLQVRAVRPHLQDLMDKRIVTYTGGEWTVGDLFDRMEQMPPHLRPDLTQSGSLTTRIATMVRDEYLAQEGYRRSFEHSTFVQEELNRVRGELVANYQRQALLDTVRVRDVEVEAFYGENIVRFRIPERVKIREVMVRDRNLADSLYQVIEAGGNLVALAGRYSVRKWAAKQGGDLGYFSESAFGTVGKQAFQMKIGELAGPVPVKLDTFTVGYSVFRLLDRTPTEVPALSSIRDRVYKDAIGAKQQRVLARFLVGVKQQHPVVIHTAVLAKIPISEDMASGRPMDLLLVKRR